MMEDEVYIISDEDNDYYEYGTIKELEDHIKTIVEGGVSIDNVEIYKAIPLKIDIEINIKEGK